MTWGEIDREEWEALSAEAPLQQTWTWGDVLARTGAGIARRARRDPGGAAEAIAQVATRRFGPLPVSLVSRGPLGRQEVPLRGLLAGLRLLIVTPESGRIPRAIPIMTPAWHAALDLMPSLKELRGGLDPKLRNKISRSERARLDVRREDGSPSDYAWLLEAEAAQQRDRRYRNWPPGLVNTWHACGGDVRVYVARDGGTPLAAMLFLLHGRVATYHVGWAGPEGRQAAAHPLCMWRAIADLKEAGIERLDLGTVNTEDAPGLARFKLATGATVRPLGATYFVLPG